MKHGIFLVLGLVLLIAVVSLLPFFRGNKPSKTSWLDEHGNPASSPAAMESHAQVDTGIAGFLNAFSTKIDLYGKVVDQDGNPVAGATVTLSPVDQVDEDQSKTKTTLTSDQDGKFSIHDKAGFSMGVRAIKEGYMTLPPLGGPSSSAMITYASQAESGKRFRNPATPLVLTLYKIDQVAPIFYVKQTSWRLPMDGAVRQIALDSKKGVGPHQIEFRFKSDWIKIPKTNEIYGKQYNWSLEAKIPGGGFIESYSDYVFEAPEIGYQESIRVEYLETMLQGKWEKTRAGRYFVKFPDGSYGRIRFNIDSSSETNPLDMVSWLNLKPSSRNLSSNDWDPTRVLE